MFLYLMTQYIYKNSYYSRHFDNFYVLDCKKCRLHTFIPILDLSSYFCLKRSAKVDFNLSNQQEKCHKLRNGF